MCWLYHDGQVDQSWTKHQWPPRLQSPVSLLSNIHQQTYLLGLTPTRTVSFTSSWVNLNEKRMNVGDNQFYDCTTISTVICCKSNTFCQWTSQKVSHSWNCFVEGKTLPIHSLGWCYFSGTPTDICNFVCLKLCVCSVPIPPNCSLWRLSGGSTFTPH